MRSIGSEHHPAALGMHAHCLQAGSVAANMDQLDTWREFGISIVEMDSRLVDATHDVDDIVHIVGKRDGLPIPISSASTLEPDRLR